MFLFQRNGIISRADVNEGCSKEIRLALRICSNQPPSLEFFSYSPFELPTSSSSFASAALKLSDWATYLKAQSSSDVVGTYGSFLKHETCHNLHSSNIKKAIRDRKAPNYS
jgi:hypothetical protein